MTKLYPIGTKVICQRNTPSGNLPQNPQPGLVYTIRAINYSEGKWYKTPTSPDGWYLFEEIHNPVSPLLRHEPGFNPNDYELWHLPATLPVPEPVEVPREQDVGYILRRMDFTRVCFVRDEL